MTTLQAAAGQHLWQTAPGELSALSGGSQLAAVQDWNYIAGDCMELTLELSQHKWPQAEQLPKLFEDNLPAMLAYPLAGAFGGVW